MIYTTIPSPIGELLAAKDDRGYVTEIHFAGASPELDWERDDAAFDDVREQLAAYFRGELRAFDLPLAPAGTEFQRSVWNVLRTIPYGETRSYLDVANALGKPSACRAVGAANGANPLPIVVPCHRVIGTSGALTGFGGGIDVKRRLLELEGGARSAEGGGLLELEGGAQSAEGSGQRRLLESEGGGQSAEGSGQRRLLESEGGARSAEGSGQRRLWR